jgi:ABC-type branched-subunit amino acid transport system ATPase component
MMAQPLFSARKLTKTFGGLTAIADVNMKVHRDEIHALIGPNGAGKTTLMNLITGVYAPSAGEIVFDGREISRMRPSARTAAGIGRTFQHPVLFAGLSVLENVALAACSAKPWNLAGYLLRTKRAKADEKLAHDAAHDWLRFVGLASKSDHPVDALSPAERRRVEVARAMAGSPRLLLLDEPFGGMTQGEALSLCELIQQIRSRGVSVVIIDHNMSIIMKMADTLTVLSFGRLICDGTPAEVRQSEDVIAAYLGREHAAAHA